MAFASNMAARNAARSALKARGISANRWADYFKLEKVDGEWHALLVTAFPPEPWESLQAEREGIYPFPTAASVTAAMLAQAQRAADALANAQQAATTLPNGKIWVRISSVPKPTKLVHIIADQMNADAAAAGKPAPTRKEVQDECIRRGIASGTARTQYQAWLSAKQSAQANAQRAKELSDAMNARNRALTQAHSTQDDD